MKKFKIGDLVFVSNYRYKSGINGKNHIFVIIDDEQIVGIEYFGFLLSSRIYKKFYPYNELLKKDFVNQLHKTSIVKCDDLIKINECEIKFKIGKVRECDFQRFINTFAKYLDENT